MREGTQYLIRLPPGMRERLEQRAAENGRTVKAEIVEALEAHLATHSLHKRVARIEQHLGLGPLLASVGLKEKEL